MPRYDPRAERATRDVVSRAMFAEMREGQYHARTAASTSRWRTSGRSSVAKEFKGMVERCADCGFDLAGGLVEVVPTAHYMMGGVEFRRDCSTRAAGPFRRGRGLRRRARRQPPGRQRRRQLHRVRRGRGRRDGALGAQSGVCRRRHATRSTPPSRACESPVLRKELGRNSSPSARRSTTSCGKRSASSATRAGLREAQSELAALETALDASGLARP